ncbi:hypothetical protein [Luteolibacter marinus]|uniref:hypothetical protein n=1 Tax=Luteolibacter marinus TaxID=2776705 RepID=UPI0018663F21|nr:hypothetical protein [Luteolibacter marinus]
MSADRIAELRPAIREAIDGAPNTCVTFEIDGDSDKWLQFVDHTINAAYPHIEDPSHRIEAMSGVAIPRIVDWEAGEFATFELARVELTPLAKWIDEYFVSILGCDAGGYHFSIVFQTI